MKSITTAQSNKGAICCPPVRLAWMSALTKSICLLLSWAAASALGSLPDQGVGQLTAKMRLADFFGRRTQAPHVTKSG